MATMLESGQIMLRGAQGGVPMVQPSIQPVEPIAARAAAQQSETMAQLLDRMSTSAFQEAGRLAQQEAIKFAADNPPTPEQIELAKNGVPLPREMRGSIYNEALRKARSLQLASHFEIEGRNELAKILTEVQNGSITGEQASQKIATFTSGYSKTLVGEDPEAAIKFRATMALHGNTVLNSAYEAQMKREQQQKLIKLDMDIDNVGKLLYAAAVQVPDQFDALVDVHRKNISMTALTLGNLGVQREYSDKFEKMVRAAKVSVITNQLQNDAYFTNTTQTIADIRSGSLGMGNKYNNMLINLVATDQAAVEDIVKTFRAEVSARITQREDNERVAKREREGRVNDLMIEYFTPGTSQTRQRQIAFEAAKLNVMSIEQLEKFLDPKQKPGDPKVFAAIEYAINLGDIPDFQTLLSISNRNGMSGEQFKELSGKLKQPMDRDRTDAIRFIRRASGTPDVVSVFASEQDQHKIDKEQKINGYFDALTEDFRAKNPGQRIPFRTLAEQAVQQYDRTEKADARKAGAATAIKNTVDDLVGKKMMPPGISITADTNLDDLARQYPKLGQTESGGGVPIDYLRQQQRILREVAR